MGVFQSKSVTELELAAEKFALEQKINGVTENVMLPIMDHSQFSYDYTKLDLPLDSEGFVESFDGSNTVGIADFFDKYGVVVIRNCLNREECIRSEDEVWSHLDRHYGVKRSDPNTWENGQWPGLHKLGILGSVPVLSKQLHANRLNPNIQKIYKFLFKTNTVKIAIQRVGMMRPTRGVKMSPDSEPVDRVDWETVSEWPHLDMSPWTFKVNGNSFLRGTVEVDDTLKLQAILALKDCGPDDGGLRVLPGFHKHIRGWAHLNRHLHRPEDRAAYLQLPVNDPITRDLQKVPLRAGSLCIWRSELVHDTYSCVSASGRMIQYMKMAAGNDETVREWDPFKQ